MTSIPRSIPPNAVRQLLASIDRRTPGGRRDYAILLLLARLGLRASEVVFLELDDIDWTVGQVSVRGKGGQRTVLPLSAEVGEAIATYLRHGRPRSTSRRIFLRIKAPIRGFLGQTAIGSIVRHTLARTGIKAPTKGAHQFRHALAMQMLRHGASLTEIGEVLRHRSPQTTTIYAKVDLDALRPLALPWPGRCAMSTLRVAVQQYLTMRRGLGFKLHEAGKVLLKFVTFMEQHRASVITSRLALDWAQQSSTVQPAEWARRLSIVRGFARHRSATDPRTEIPPDGLLPYRPKRARPYVYSEQEIRSLLRAALKLPGRGGMRPWTYNCLLGLLSVTGLRLGEARNLELQDVDLRAGSLRSGAPSSVSRAWYPCTHRPAACWRTIWRVASDISAGRPVPPTSSCRTGAIGRTLARSTEPSIRYRAMSVCVGLPTAMGHACTISGIDSRGDPAAWYQPVKMPNGACPSCPPISGTSMSAIRFGTSVPGRKLMHEAMARLERCWEDRP